MQNNFILDFKVENFKRFDSLEVKDIGQFNLITGDNNVGKTSLLEALMINTSDNERLIYDIHHILCNQMLHFHTERIFTDKPLIPNENYFIHLKNKLHKPISFSFNNKTTTLEDVTYFDLNSEELEFYKNKTSNYKPDIDLKYWIKIKRNGILEDIQWMYEDDYFLHKSKKIIFGYIPMVKFRNFYERDMNKFMKEIIHIDLFNLSVFDYKNMVSIIKKVIISDIIDINIQKINNEKDEMIFIATKSTNGLFVNITRFGDGVQKIIRYLIEVYYAKKLGYNTFYIDEIDTGIHFSRLKTFWVEFLNLCNNIEIQLFATTHSQECIEAYTEALEELGMEEEGRLITLKESGETIKSYTKDFSTFKYGVENGINVLG